jgi:hypothetical protein
MKNNFHQWGGSRASIAGETLFPGQSPVSTLCTGCEWWGMRLRVNQRFCRAKGDEHRLCPQELHPLLSDLAAWPIPPAHRLSRNGRGWRRSDGRNRTLRIGDGRSSCWRGGRSRRGARPEHGAHPSRLERRARFLTLVAQRARAAMANAGGIQHAQGAVGFWPAFLHKERMACWAAQRPIGLRGKHGTRKPMRKGGSRPVRWPVGRWPIQRVLRGLGFACRERRGRRSRGVSGSGFGRGRSGAWGNGRRCPIRRRIIIGRRCGRLLHPRIGQVRHAHRGRLCVLPQLQAQIPDPLADDLPEFLSPLRPRHPAVDRLFLIFIGQHRLERTPMQIQIEHIRRRKRVGGRVVKNCS